MKTNLIINANFPGGNILVDEVKNDDIFLRQDLRDTTTNWFYWAFEVGGAEGRYLTFHFTDGDVLGVRGPAISEDKGAAWRWLGNDIVSRDDSTDVTFLYLSAQQTKVLFAFCSIYTQVHLERFLANEDKSTFYLPASLLRSDGFLSLGRVARNDFSGE